MSSIVENRDIVLYVAELLARDESPSSYTAWRQTCRITLAVCPHYMTKYAGYVVAIVGHQLFKGYGCTLATNFGKAKIVSKKYFAKYAVSSVRDIDMNMNTLRTVVGVDSTGTVVLSDYGIELTICGNYGKIDVTVTESPGHRYTGISYKLNYYGAWMNFYGGATPNIAIVPLVHQEHAATLLGLLQCMFPGILPLATNNPDH